MQALEIPREGFDMAIFSFEKDGNPHLCVAQLPYRGAMVHRLDVAEDGTTGTQVVPFGTVLPRRAARAVRASWSTCPPAISACGTRRC